MTTIKTVSLSYGLLVQGGDKDSDNPTDDRGRDDEKCSGNSFCTEENPCGSAMCDYCG